MRHTTGKQVFENTQRTQLSLVAGLSFALIGCSGLQASDAEEVTTADKVGAQAAPTEVTITFGDINGCNAPKFVDKPFFEIDKGEQIRWISDDDSPFKIYFSPFAGDVIQASNGKTPVKTIPQAVPGNVTYKYTIVGDNCPDNPLDPYLRVR